MVGRGVRLAAFAFGVFALPLTAAAQQASKLESLIPAGDGSVSGRIIQLIVVVTVLSVAPGMLVMVTCFTRFVIALSFLRSGLGLADDAREPDPHQPGAVHDLLRDGADLRSGLAGWSEAAGREQNHGGGGVYAHHRAVQDLHARPCPGQGSEAVRGTGGGQMPGIPNAEGAPKRRKSRPATTPTSSCAS